MESEGAVGPTTPPINQQLPVVGEMPFGINPFIR